MVGHPGRKQLSYFRQIFLGGIVKLAIVYVVAILFYGLLIFCINFFWLEYSETMVGRRLVAVKGEFRRLTTFISNPEILPFSLYVNTTALAVSVCIAGVSKFLHIKYFFYDQMGFILRVGFWGGLHTLGTAYMLRKHFNLDFVDLLKLAVVPCLFFLAVSFDFASRIIPSIGELIVFIRRAMGGSR